MHGCAARRPAAPPRPRRRRCRRSRSARGARPSAARERLVLRLAVDHGSGSTASPTRTRPGASTSPKTPKSMFLPSSSRVPRYALISRSVSMSGLAGVRVLRRDRAARDLLVQADDGLADAHAPTEPRVLLVRLAAGDADQHPEPALVDAVDTRPVARARPATRRRASSPGRARGRRRRRARRCGRAGAARPRSAEIASDHAPFDDAPADADGRRSR